MEGVPKEAEGAKFRESILLGTTSMSEMEIKKVIDQLRSVYCGRQYNMVVK